MSPRRPTNTERIRYTMRRGHWMTTAQIRDLTGIGRGGISTVLKRLHDSGDIEREPDPMGHGAYRYRLVKGK